MYATCVDAQTKKSSVSFAQSTSYDSNRMKEPIPSSCNNEQEDGSVSKLSDTASWLSMFEDRFTIITDELCDAIEDVKLQNAKQHKEFWAQQEFLHSSLAILQHQPQAQKHSPRNPSSTMNVEETDNGQSSVISVQANHPPQLNQGAG